MRAVLILLLLVGTASAEDEPRISVGLHASAAGLLPADPYLVTMQGLRTVVRVDTDGLIVGTLGYGAIMYDDGYAQYDSRLFEGQVSYAHALCSRADRQFCALPSVGLGYHRGTLYLADSLVMDDPWTRTVSRVFAEGRMTGRILVAGHVGITAAFGLRLAASDGDRDVGFVASAGVDVGW